MSYNKNQGTSTLKKHVYHEQPYLYKKWRLFLLQMVTKTQSEKHGSKKRKIVPFLKSHNFLAINLFTTNQIFYNKAFLEDLVLYVAQGYQHFMGAYHVTIGIFEIHNIIGVVMANQIKYLLDSFGLFDKVIAYVKDERKFKHFDFCINFCCFLFDP